MTVTTRDVVQEVFANSIGPGNDTQTSAAVPNGQVWQINRIIFADKNIGTSRSSGFLVDFGNGGSREIIAAGYLTGNTTVIPIEKIYTGDGSKVFRYIRVNHEVFAKEIVLIVEGFKRIGG